MPEAKNNLPDAGCRMKNTGISNNTSNQWLQMFDVLGDKNSTQNFLKCLMSNASGHTAGQNAWQIAGIDDAVQFDQPVVVAVDTDDRNRPIDAPIVETAVHPIGFAVPISHEIKKFEKY
uniref:Uncharacterized protein n=1 Tax=Romanomermis culicivorax TaxID=13658 RepID=A0A915JK11_ROMCU